MSHVINSQIVEGLLDAKSLRTQAAVTATVASTLQLTADSEYVQILTGNTAGQVVRLPDATTLQIGHRYEIANVASVTVALQNNAGNPLVTLQPFQKTTFILQANPGAGGTWVFNTIDQSAVSNQLFVTDPAGIGNAGLVLNYTAGVQHINGTTYDIPAGSVSAPDNTTNGWVYVDIDGVVKATASLPNNANPMAQFTTLSGAVTVLNDKRDFIEINLVWGLVGDISANSSHQSASAGTSERYARADHVHAMNINLVKAGTVSAGSFAGNPKKYTVTFATPFNNTNYAVKVNGVDVRSWSYENKTAGGFVINSNANASLTGEVSWTATENGEST